MGLVAPRPAKRSPLGLGESLGRRGNSGSERRTSGVKRIPRLDHSARYNSARQGLGPGLTSFAEIRLEDGTAPYVSAIRLQPALAAGLYWRGIAKRLKGDAAAGEADIAAAKKIDPEVDQ